MAFNWSLSDSKSLQVSRTLLSILAIFNNAVVWMVCPRPPTSKSSSPFSNPLVTVPNAPITIGIIVTCIFHRFFNSLARSRYLSLFSHSFSFILWQPGQQSQQFLAPSPTSRCSSYWKGSLLVALDNGRFLYLYIYIYIYIYIYYEGIIRSGLLAEIRWSVCMSKSHRSLCVLFSRIGAGLCIYRLFVIIIIIKFFVKVIYKTKWICFIRLNRFPSGC